MCGRYVRISDKQRIAEHFQVHGPSIPDFGSSYNIAPQTFQPVVVQNGRTGNRQIILMRWGLLPSWSRDLSMPFSTINARAENLSKSPAFRDAFRRRRALCPAEAFFEWQRLSSRMKQPFAIAMKDRRPYAFAALWERWLDRREDTELLTFTIITTSPNAVVRPLHDRMPVIIPERDYDRWLEPGDPAHPPIDLLRPYDAEQMVAWKVDKAVGHVMLAGGILNDRPELIDPLREDAVIASEDIAPTLF